MFELRNSVPRHERINPFFIGLVILAAVDLEVRGFNALTVLFIIRACAWAFRNTDQN